MSEEESFDPNAVILGADTAISSALILADRIAPSRLQGLYPGFALLIESIVIHESIVYPVFLAESLTELPYFSKAAIDEFEEIATAIRINSNDIERAKLILNNVGMFEEIEPAIKDLGIDGEPSMPLTQIAVSSFTLTTIMFIIAYTDGFAFKFDGLFFPYLKDAIDVFLEKEIRDNITDNTIDEITKAAQEKIKDLNSLLPGNYFALDIPIIFNYVLDKVHKKEDVISTAFDIRNSKEARAFRNQLTLLNEATRVGDDKLLVPIIEEMRDKINTLGKRLDQPSIGLSVGFPSAIAFDPLGILKRFNSKRKRHLIFIDQLYNVGIHARSMNRKLGKLL